MNGREAGKLRHTLNAGGKVGTHPIMVINDQIVCAADQKILSWDINKLTVHDGPCVLTSAFKNNAVGGVMNSNEVHNIQDPNEVEVSAGETAHSIVAVPYTVTHWAKFYYYAAAMEILNPGAGTTHLVMTIKESYSVMLLDLSNILVCGNLLCILS